jgi:hypothetical protein
VVEDALELLTTLFGLKLLGAVVFTAKALLADDAVMLS